MGGQSRKATKKFEKNHLKDVLERRKDFSKIKQRQQIKAKKQARRASDYGKVADLAEETPTKAIDRKREDVDALKDMTVDEFFQGGFEIPEPKKQKKAANTASRTAKRKRNEGLEETKDDSASRSDNYSDEASVVDDGVAKLQDEVESGAHKEHLDNLKEKDPEFYNYLKENDAELLEFGEDGEFANLSSEDESPKKKRKKTKTTVDEPEEEPDETNLTMPTVEKWKIALAEQHSLRAMRQVVLAFRAAAYINEEGGTSYKYTISSPDVYHQLLITALKCIPDVLAHHLPIKENASGRVRVPTDSKKYRTLTPLLKSHAASVHHLLENLSDAPTIQLTLESILPLLPYFLSFKKALKNLTKAIVGIWSDSSSTDATRIKAFLLIRRLAVISDASLREAVLKTTYQGLIRGSRNTTTHNLPGINLMKNSAAELWGVDPSIGYTTGFTYIRQLAIHLRTTITQPTKDSYKAIYNWQYTHSLDFWSRVLSTHCSVITNVHLKKSTDSPLHPLIYPLVQITLGALRLIPTPAYFPLRFQLTRSILRISRSTNTYIPLAASLLEVLQSPELKKSPKPSTLRPLDFNTALRAPKAYLRTRIYQDGLGEQVAELLAEFFGVWAKNIAFPELVIPPTVFLKRWLKEASSSSSAKGPKNPFDKTATANRGNKNHKVNTLIALVVQKVNANAKFVEEQRRTVDFAPSDRAGVEAFLQDVAWEDLPLGAYVVGMRKQKEERERILEEGRKADEAKRARERRTKNEVAVEDDDEDDAVEMHDGHGGDGGDDDFEGIDGGSNDDDDE